MKITFIPNYFNYEQPIGEQPNPYSGHYAIMKAPPTVEYERFREEHPSSDDEDVDEKAHMKPPPTYRLQLDQAYWNPARNVNMKGYSLTKKIRDSLEALHVYVNLIKPIYWQFDGKQYPALLIGPYLPREKGKVNATIDWLQLPKFEVHHVYHNNDHHKCDYVMFGTTKDDGHQRYFPMKKDEETRTLSFTNMKGVGKIGDKKIEKQAWAAIPEWEHKLDLKFCEEAVGKATEEKEPLKKKMKKNKDTE